MNDSDHYEYEDEQCDPDQCSDPMLNDPPYLFDDDGAELAEYEDAKLAIDRANELFNEAAPYEMCREAMADEQADHFRNHLERK